MTTVMIQLCNNANEGSFTSVTSRPAPAITPDASAAISVGSSTLQTDRHSHAVAGQASNIAE